MVQSSLEHIKFESKIIIENVPISWISKIELYYPDLPGFPIIYTHAIVDDIHVYGFPASISYDMRDDKYCDAKIIFLCNKDLDNNKSVTIKKKMISELENRFGLVKRVIEEDIINCSQNKNYSTFLHNLWKNYSVTLIGDAIPYGKLYEEFFSIVRFVSAWNPKTGRQSEMRMLYNFLSTFGEEIQIEGKWNFLEFFLLPTYEEVIKQNFDYFPKFKKLFEAVRKIWEHYFIKSIPLKGHNYNIKMMTRGWPENKEKFIEEVSGKLKKENKITSEEKDILESLVDVFNRHPRRTAFFVSCTMQACEKNYRTWDRNFFEAFYTTSKSKNGKGAGISEKVIACFLQQGFGNEEVTPVDTWVESFHKFVLGIPNKKFFLMRFQKKENWKE